MKRLFFLLIICLTAFGCADRLISKVPSAEFRNFEYHRAGNMSSAHIKATNSKVKDDQIEIEMLNIQEDWGPFVNFNILLEGYKRKIK
jgi:hypothetical protein